MVSVDAEMLERVIAELLVSGYAEPARMADEPRFATAIYRAALECGVRVRRSFAAPGYSADTWTVQTVR